MILLKTLRIFSSFTFKVIFETGFWTFSILHLNFCLSAVNVKVIDPLNEGIFNSTSWSSLLLIFWNYLSKPNKATNILANLAILSKLISFSNSENFEF